MAAHGQALLGTETSADTMMTKSEACLCMGPACEIETLNDLIEIMRPGQNGWHFADYIFKIIFLNKMLAFYILTISWHWFKYWLGALQGACHYLNQWWSRYLGGCFKDTYELLNLRAIKFSPVNKIHTFQCMGKIFCVEFQRVPLKFHRKYLTHTLKDAIFMHNWNFKSS